MSVAKVYARALYEAASEGGGKTEAQLFCDQIEAEMESLLQVIHASKEVKTALFSPVTTAKEKAAIVQEISKKLSLSVFLFRFCLLLVTKGRLTFLGEIREIFATVRLLAEGGILGRLVSADGISLADSEELEKAFSKKLGRRVKFRPSIDSLLLAGMKVTVSGVTYDGTLRSQLQRLRDRLMTGLNDE